MICTRDLESVFFTADKGMMLADASCGMALPSFRRSSQSKIAKLKFFRNVVAFRNRHVSVTTARLPLPALLSSYFIICL